MNRGAGHPVRQPRANRSDEGHDHGTCTSCESSRIGADTRRAGHPVDRAVRAGPGALRPL